MAKKLWYGFLTMILNWILKLLPKKPEAPKEPTLSVQQFSLLLQLADPNLTWEMVLTRALRTVRGHLQKKSELTQEAHSIKETANAEYRNALQTATTNRDAGHQKASALEQEAESLARAAEMITATLKSVGAKVEI